MQTKLFPFLTGTCVLWVLLLNPAARATDTDATNTPPAAIAASEPTAPTYDETINWLKAKYASEICTAKGKYATVQHSQKLETCPDGRIQIQDNTHNIDTDSRYDRSSVCQSTFDIRSIKIAYVGGMNFFPDYFQVSVETKDSLKAIQFSEGPNNSIEDHLVIFWTSDKETAEKVAKAFNHLIKLAPKDLF